MGSATDGSRSFSVEVFSDVVCPWCYIGKRRFARALDELAADPDFGFDIDVVYRPFQLDPAGAPRPGRAGDRRVRPQVRRAGSGPQQLIADVTAIAAAEGLEFHLDRAVRANTADANRLLWWTLWQHGPGAQAEVKESLLARLLHRRRRRRRPGGAARPGDAVRAAARPGGRDCSTVRRGLEALAVGMQRCAEAGIAAVPTYVVNGQWSIPGAQDPGVFVGAFRRLAAKRVA